jgi:hypothetical protein
VADGACLDLGGVADPPGGAVVADGDPERFAQAAQDLVRHAGGVEAGQEQTREQVLGGGRAGRGWLVGECGPLLFALAALDVEFVVAGAQSGCERVAGFGVFGLPEQAGLLGGQVGELPVQGSQAPGVIGAGVLIKIGHGGGEVVGTVGTEQAGVEEVAEEPDQRDLGHEHRDGVAVGASAVGWLAGVVGGAVDDLAEHPPPAHRAAQVGPQGVGAAGGGVPVGPATGGGAFPGWGDGGGGGELLRADDRRMGRLVGQDPVGDRVDLAALLRRAAVPDHVPGVLRVVQDLPHRGGLDLVDGQPGLVLALRPPGRDGVGDGVRGVPVRGGRRSSLGRCGPRTRPTPSPACPGRTTRRCPASSAASAPRWPAAWW